MFPRTNAVLWGNPINPSHPLNNGLLGWWMADCPHSQGSTWFDLRGHYHGALTTMDLSTAWTTAGGFTGGKKCLDLDGSSDYVLITHDAGLNVGSITVAVWFNADAWSVDYTSLISKEQTNSPWGPFDCRKQAGTGNIEVYYVTAGGSAAVYTPSAISTGVWNQFVFTYNQGNNSGEAFLNGVSGGASTSATGALITNSFNMWFGGNPGAGGRYFNGKIADVRVYDRALKALEVTDLYKESRLGYPTALVRRS